MPTDLGFRIQLIVTFLVVIAVLAVGIQTGDWTGLVLVIPLIIIVPIVAKLPAEPPNRRRRGTSAAGDKDEAPRRY